MSKMITRNPKYYTSNSAILRPGASVGMSISIVIFAALIFFAFTGMSVAVDRSSKFSNICSGHNGVNQASYKRVDSSDFKVNYEELSSCESVEENEFEEFYSYTYADINIYQKYTPVVIHIKHVKNPNTNNVLVVRKTVVLQV